MATILPPPPRPAVQGLLEALRDLGASAWSHLGTRIDLVILELTEERARLVHGVAAAAFATVGAALALAFGGLALIMWLDDPSQRALAALLLGLAFAALAIAAGLLAHSRLGRRSALFRTSLAELRNDVAVLRAASRREST